MNPHGDERRRERGRQRDVRTQRAANTVKALVTPEQLEVARLAYFDRLTLAEQQRNRDEEAERGANWHDAMKRTLEQAELERLIYQGERDRFLDQQNERDRRSNRCVAITNVILAGAITLATLAQAAFAAMTYFRDAPGGANAQARTR